MPTIAQVLRQSQQNLASSTSSQLDAEVLLAFVLDCDRSHLLAWPEKTLTAQQTTHYEHLVSERQEGWPVAYLTEQKEFWSLPLKVTPAVLIPRPETELLVEHALALIPREAQWRIADLGTGSGAIGLAIAYERPNCTVLAVENSLPAMQVAKHNAKALNIRNIEFLQTHWEIALRQQSINMIVSNPPYIAEQDPHLLVGDVRFEPQEALVAGEKGLDCLLDIIKLGARELSADDYLLFEHGYDQAATVRSLLSNIEWVEQQQFTDLAGITRVTMARKAKR